MNQFQVFILYEFAKEVQKDYFEKKIWIIEDNALCHLAVRCMTKCIWIEKRIEYAFHFANSFDLNEIESFWGEIKRIIVFLDLGLSGVVVLNICQKEISYIFNHLDWSIVNEWC